jgi:hypothetical protein
LAARALGRAERDSYGLASKFTLIFKTHVSH